MKYLDVCVFYFCISFAKFAFREQLRVEIYDYCFALAGLIMRNEAMNY